MRAACWPSTTRSCIWPNPRITSADASHRDSGRLCRPGAGDRTGGLSRDAVRTSASTCGPTVSTCICEICKRRDRSDCRSVEQTKPLLDARHQWTEQLVWARGEKTQLHEDRPVPLVTYGESCLSHRVSVAALSGAGLDYDVAFRASGIAEPGRCGARGRRRHAASCAAACALSV